MYLAHILSLINVLLIKNISLLVPLSVLVIDDVVVGGVLKNLPVSLLLTLTILPDAELALS